MPPVHRSPFCIIRIMLEKQMICSIHINHTVGIVHPAIFWRKVISRAVVFQMILFRGGWLWSTCNDRQREQTKSYLFYYFFHLYIMYLFFYNLLLCSQIDFISQASRSEEHTSELQSRENLVCR